MKTGGGNPFGMNNEYLDNLLDDKQQSETSPSFLSKISKTVSKTTRILARDLTQAEPKNKVLTVANAATPTAHLQQQQPNTIVAPEKAKAIDSTTNLISTLSMNLSSLSMKTQEQPEIEGPFKVVLVGQPGVGKTKIIECANKDSFWAGYDPTIGIDFRSCVKITYLS